MFITEAFAQAAQGGSQPGISPAMAQILMLVAIMVLFYFLLIRPQQRRMKAHQEMVSNLRRNDTVVTSGGLIGKVKSVQEDEVRLELAPNVEVRVVRTMISEVRTRTDPAPANDASAS
jgi:preprotein translocase subunit YajC